MGRRDTTGGIFFSVYLFFRDSGWRRRGDFAGGGRGEGKVSREGEDVGWQRQSKVHSLHRWEF